MTDDMHELMRPVNWSLALAGLAGIMAVGSAVPGPDRDPSGGAAFFRTLAESVGPGAGDVFRPSVVRQSSSGRSRADFSAGSVSPTPATDGTGRLRLVLRLESDGAFPAQIDISTYLRAGGLRLEPAALADPEWLSIHVPAGRRRHVVAIPLSPCFARRDLARLTIIFDPRQPLELDPLSIRIEDDVAVGVLGSEDAPAIAPIEPEMKAAGGSTA